MDELSVSVILVLQEPNFVRHPEVFARVVFPLVAVVLVIIVAAILSIFLIKRYRQRTDNSRWLAAAGWIIVALLLACFAWFVSLFIR